MKKLTPFILFVLVCFSLSAQKRQGFFEIQMGALKLGVADVISANTRFAAEFPIGEDLFIGAVLDGFVSMPPTGSKLSPFDGGRYYPSGARLGFVARFAPSSARDQFYSEGSVTFGQVSTSLYGNYTVRTSEWATEYLAVINLGYNFTTRRKRTWGCYIGFGAGLLYSDEYSGDVTGRIRTGISRQFGFK